MSFYNIFFQVVYKTIRHARLFNVLFFSYLAK